LSQCACIALEDLQELATQIRSRLEWSDVQLLRSALAFLDTRSWYCSQADSDEDDMASIKSAVESLSSHSREPLEAIGVSLASIQDEIEEAVDYARNYFRRAPPAHSDNSVPSSTEYSLLGSPQSPSRSEH